MVRLDGDVHALCAFSAYAVPQLAQLGWRVDIAPGLPVAGGRARRAALRATVGADERARRDWFSLELGVEVDGQRVNLLPALLDLLERAADLERSPRLPARAASRCRSATRSGCRCRPSGCACSLRVLRRAVRRRRPARPVAAVPRARGARASWARALQTPERPVRWTGDTDCATSATRSRSGRAPAARWRRRPACRRRCARTSAKASRWLQHLRARDAGGVLADDMGLGKTLQTIAHCSPRRRPAASTGRRSSSTPTSLVGNWARELAKFAPTCASSCCTARARSALRRGRARRRRHHDLPAPRARRRALARARVPPARPRRGAGDQEPAQPGPPRRRARSHARHRAVPVRHAGREQPRRAVGAVRLPDPGPARRRRLRSATRSARRSSAAATASALEALRELVAPYILRRMKDDGRARTCRRRPRSCAPVELGGAQRELYESIRVAAHAEVRQRIRKKRLAALDHRDPRRADEAAPGLLRPAPGRGRRRAQRRATRPSRAASSSCSSSSSRRAAACWCSRSSRACSR